MLKRSIVLMAVALGIAFAMGAAPSNAQTVGEYAAALNDAGSRTAMTNYLGGGTDFRPSFQAEPAREAMDYRSDQYTSTNYAATDYDADFSATTDYGSSKYSAGCFGSATDYRSVNDYSNPTELP